MPQQPQISEEATYSPEWFNSVLDSLGSDDDNGDDKKKGGGGGDGPQSYDLGASIVKALTPAVKDAVTRSVTPKTPVPPYVPPTDQVDSNLSNFSDTLATAAGVPVTPQAPIVPISPINPTVPSPTGSVIGDSLHKIVLNSMLNFAAPDGQTPLDYNDIINAINTVPTPVSNVVESAIPASTQSTPVQPVPTNTVPTTGPPVAGQVIPTQSGVTPKTTPLPITPAPPVNKTPPPEPVAKYNEGDPPPAYNPGAHDHSIMNLTEWAASQGETDEGATVDYDADEPEPPNRSEYTEGGDRDPDDYLADLRFWLENSPYAKLRAKP